MQGIQSIRGVEVGGKRVLFRTSLNVPVNADGSIGDTFRLMRALPTLQYLIEQKAKVIIVGYIGREGATLAPVAAALQKLVPHASIRFSGLALSHVASEVAKLQNGECLMLENIRRESGEETNDPALAQTLAGLADIFVSDSFAEAHRAYASNVGVASLLPRYIGFLLQEEIEKLTLALTPPKNSIAIVGGAKFETKEPVLKKLLATYGAVLVGGALANDILKSRGVSVGTSLLSKVSVPESMAGYEELFAPTDVVVWNRELKNQRTALISDVQAQEFIVDIGTATAERWAAQIDSAEFVLWSGPMGVYEEGFTTGTNALARALVESSAHAFIGGGDTAAALAKFSLDPNRIFVSTGGGAMLDFLANGSLPGVEALKNSAV